jgi:ribonuclease Z
VDAAKIAAEAGVGQLLLGHFSIRYRDRGVLLREALPVFGQTLLAEEGKTYRWMRKK